jgi:ADP-dependent NAD(P)H-hydrate dehydratase / NAD(P)H-hydrate epimerase
MKVVTARQMQALDRRAIGQIGIPAACLMENAGRLVADEAGKALRRRRGKRVCVLCGTGNNGGDGLVAARHLWNSGVRVSVLLAGDPAGMSPESTVNVRIAKKLGIPVVRAFKTPWKTIEKELGRADVIVDALFGIGLNRVVDGGFRRLIEAVNAVRRPVIAVDVPSGLDATTGRIWARPSRRP